jgi:hypothetical protein
VAFLFSGGEPVDEIVISKRILLVGLAVIGLGIAAVWGIPWLRAAFAPPVEVETLPIAAQTEPGNEADLARQAAVAGAQAFYSLDYRQGQDAWLEALCAVSTETGCDVYQNVVVPALWSALEATETTTTVDVNPLGMVREDTVPTRGDAPMKVWRLQIHLSAPWVVQQEPLTDFPALALVVQEDGVWKFERFLTDDELSAFAATEAQP